MPWGIIISTAVVVGLMFFILRSISKFKITNKYIEGVMAQVFPDKTFDFSTLNISEFNPQEMSAEESVKQKYYFEINVEDSDKQSNTFEGCLYDASADYDEEKYNAEQKKARPKDEGMNSSGAGFASTNHVAGIEIAQGMLQDQAKLEKEEKIIDNRIKKYQIDIEITKKISDVSSIVPKIYVYDSKRHFVLSEFCGRDLLKDVLVTTDEDNKIGMLKSLVREIAHAQNGFKSVSLLVPNRRDMSLEDFRSMLKQGLGELVKAKLLTKEQVSDILNEYYSVAQWLADNFKRNIRFRYCTPYEIYVANNKPIIRNWTEYDTSYELNNIVELLKDPTTDLSLEQEEEIIKVYSDTRFGENKLDLTVKQYHLSSCNILTVNLCYMILYMNRKLEADVDTDVLVNWDKEHFDKLFSNAIEAWSRYEESKPYADMLKSIFSQILR